MNWEMGDLIIDDQPLPSFSDLFTEICNSNIGNYSTDLVSELSKQQTKKRSLESNEELDNRSTKETFGKWTPEEHRLFLEGVMLYGKDWKRMVPLIKTRTLIQIRTHAQKVFQSTGLKKSRISRHSDSTLPQNNNNITQHQNPSPSYPTPSLLPFQPLTFNSNNNNCFPSQSPISQTHASKITSTNSIQYPPSSSFPSYSSYSSSFPMSISPPSSSSLPPSSFSYLSSLFNSNNSLSFYPDPPLATTNSTLSYDSPSPVLSSSSSQSLTFNYADGSTTVI